MGTGRRVQNEKELHLSIGCFAKLNAHLGLKLKVVNPAAMSVAKLVDVMARARIVVGVSGEHVRSLVPSPPASPSTSLSPVRSRPSRVEVVCEACAPRVHAPF